MRKLRVWTCFWGEKHIDLFEKALVRSLMWPLNRKALQGATWDICTKRSEFIDVADIAKKIDINVELHEIDEGIQDNHPRMGSVLLQIFLPSIKRCIDSDSQMLIAPPDTIFGGDSIKNILILGQDKNTVVFVPHIRVHDSILGALNTANNGDIKLSIGNARLVTLAMENAHKSFTESERGFDRINTFIGGIHHQKLDDGLYAIQHMLPTPYLINWTMEDYNFFSNPPPFGQYPIVFGDIDHTWPANCVYPNAIVERVNGKIHVRYNDERARIITSSDVAFMVEITGENSNIPPLQPVQDVEHPDKFWRQAFHNKVNRQIICTFRGE